MKSVAFPPEQYRWQVEGVIPAARSHSICCWVFRPAGPAVNLVLAPDGAMVESIASELLLWAGGTRQCDVAVLPAAGMDEEPLPARLREEIECDRLRTLTLLGEFAEKTPEERRLVVVTTPHALFQPVPPRETLTRGHLHLKPGDTISIDVLRDRLVGGLDYDAEAVCEYPGQFALRGGLVDVYPLNGDFPVRLDFFGDELESIRAMDPTTQRSTTIVDEVRIAPRLPKGPVDDLHYLEEYFGGAIQWLLVEPDELLENSHALFETFERISDQRFSFQTLLKSRKPAKDEWISISEFSPTGDPWQRPDRAVRLQTVEVDAVFGEEGSDLLGVDRMLAETARREQLLRKAHAFSRERNVRVDVFAGEASGAMDRLGEILGELGVGVEWLKVHQQDLGDGFYWIGPADSDAAFCEAVPGAVSPRLVLTQRELFGRRMDAPLARRRVIPHRSRVDQLLDFAELADGDYLVHLSHGICIYRGISRMKIAGRDEEVISLEFDESVTLHLPLSEAHLLTRYVGLSKMSPRLGRLGSNIWQKSRRAAEEATLDYAADMLRLQATRQVEPGHAFAPDSAWQDSFESGFPWRETVDQLHAIQDTKRDMEKPEPMDRLICGDVGFGKTEVAIRAAFKAVMDGHQVAVLCPTTVLAQQHFQTFRERMSAFPLTVEMISRFRTARQQKEILRQLSEGRVDILIGTHRLLSGDVKFHRLGLVVIDEEHRFGVRHKDRLKHLRAQVDVLTMSATPIPRTLYLALMGARDMSVIETPPEDRLPIETIVRAYDPDLVRDAIARELDRGGQVFYLHNRVQTIASVGAEIQKRFPKARVEVGHGQMSEHLLEKVMTRFAAGEVEILVCTTIIENGLDIPNCNTIIIEGADRFGLSQLYQLRGRVGRFRRQAYAYLLLHRHARLLEQARRRLSAMRQYNQLGAGFRIAMRDLELRGAGNLLGARQSGHIAAVGFELYCQLLGQSIRRLKGDPVAAAIRASVILDFIDQAGSRDSFAPENDFQILEQESIEGGRVASVEAGLPMDYLPEARLRIDFYRQLAISATADEVDEIAAAMEDRFGPLPKEALRLVSITRIRTLAQSAGIQSVVTEGARLKCLRAGSRRDDYLKLGNRFPRLTAKDADLRLREIERFLLRSSPCYEDS